jgi:hypothetical protein
MALTSHNFMIADLAGCAWAFALFSLVIFVPGYVLGWAMNLLDFRRLSGAWQAMLSVPLGISLCPIVDYLLGRWFPSGAVWIFYGTLWAAFLAVAVRQLPSRVSRGTVIPASIATGWVVVALFSLVDVQWQDRLYFSIVSYDYTVRSAFTSAISRTGIPPHNPFFSVSHGFPLRYHYYWLLPCSLVNRMGGAAVSARQALIGGTLWCGLGLMCLPPLYLRFVQAKGTQNLSRRSLLAIALFGITGLDIVPTLLLACAGVVLPEMEWWNEQVTSWVGSVLWVPHSVSGLIACLTGFLLLWKAATEQDRAHRAAATAAGGLALASATGASIYISFTFAVFLAAWICLTLVKRWYRETAILAAAGAVAACLSWPFLRDLAGTSAASGPFVEPAVRTFFLTYLLSPVLPHWASTSLNVLFLPLNYFLELGVFFVAGMWQARQYLRRGGELGRAELASLAMAGTSVLVCTFLRSGATRTNDLGFRGFLPAQFVLLLWTAELLADWPAAQTAGLPSRARILALLALGAAGSIYEVGLLRLYPILLDARKAPVVAWLSNDRNLGRRTLSARSAYEQVRASTPETVIVQHNPDIPDDDLFYGLYADRQTAVETRGCGARFGGDPASCAGLYAAVTAIFETTDARDPQKVREACREGSIDILLAKDTDPAWSDKQSWVWTNPPISAQRYARAVRCP